MAVPACTHARLDAGEVLVSKGSRRWRTCAFEIDILLLQIAQFGRLESYGFDRRCDVVAQYSARSRPQLYQRLDSRPQPFPTRLVDVVIAEGLILWQLPSLSEMGRGKFLIPDHWRARIVKGVPELAGCDVNFLSDLVLIRATQLRAPGVKGAPGNPGKYTCRNRCDPCSDGIPIY